MTKRLLAILAMSTAGAAGCTAPGLQGVLPYQVELDEAQQTISSGHLPPPRNVPQGEWEATLERVARKIAPSVREVCRTTQAANCSMTGLDRISIVHDPSINAFVDEQHRIGVHSGLIQQASSDDEIAAVLAHEYGHVLARHLDRRSENEAQGMLAGALIGWILAYETGVNDTADWMLEGQAAGATAYSQHYELEADYYSALILSNAGIDLDHGRNLLLRLARASQGRSAGWRGSAALMANTHPANDFRIARWEGIAKTIADSKAASPSGNDGELRLSALDRLFTGNNGIVRTGDMARWINPKTGSSGMMTLTTINPIEECGKNCVRYSQTDYQQGGSGTEIRYACWKPGGNVEFFGTKKPWGFFGGGEVACAGVD